MLRGTRSRIIGSSVVVLVAAAACSSLSREPAAPSPAGDTGTADGGIETIDTDAGVLTVAPLGSTTQAIGASGGTISLDGASLVVPAGALSQSTSIAITAWSVQPPSGAPVTLYQFAPDGLTFGVSATINLPVRGGTSGVIHWSEAEDGVTVFDELPTSVVDNIATANVTHFSSGFYGPSLTGGGIDVCTTPGPNGPAIQCPKGYSCGPEHLCSPDLSGVLCGEPSPNLFPFVCIPDPDAGTDGGHVVVTVDAGVADAGCYGAGCGPNRECGSGLVCWTTSCGCEACVSPASCTPNPSYPNAAYGLSCFTSQGAYCCANFCDGGP
jgi:hypothetical protein